MDTNEVKKDINTPINEYFKSLIMNLKPLLGSYNHSIDGFGKHFNYTYNNQDYRISLMFEESICIFKKGSDDDYKSQMVGDRMFNPIISTIHKINNFKEFLDKIKLEISFWD